MAAGPVTATYAGDRIWFAFAARMSAGQDEILVSLPSPRIALDCKNIGGTRRTHKFLAMFRKFRIGGNAGDWG
jgi:hypothetical protein